MSLRMVDANKNDEAPKSGKDAIENDNDPLNSINTMEEEEEEEEDDDDVEEDYEEEEESEKEEDEDDEEEPEEEKVNDDGNAVAVVSNEGTETNKEKAVKENAVKENAVKENAVKENAVKENAVKENAVKEDEKKAEEPKSEKKSVDNLKSKEKRPRDKNKKKSERNDSRSLAVNGDKPESSKQKKASKRAETMGMVFMCSSKTKTDCFRYKILGLPESKKDQVLKIYRGMRLFLFDVDLRLMYGIFKAAGPGGYNIEPKAFKSEFPSQVRFTVLDDCLPLAEEKFKSILKGNYYSRNKFDGLLKSEQVKKLCKLFVEMSRGSGRTKSGVKARRSRPRETRRTRPLERRRSRSLDRHRSRSREKRRRYSREEERRPRSPPSRERRRYTDYDYDYDRQPVLYDREPPVSRYHPPQPPVMGSPVRLYAYERQPLDIPPYVRDRVPEPPPYRVVERERDPEPYLTYSREPPLYRDEVYTVPPPIVSREYHHPSTLHPSEYRVSGGSRVPSYRDVDIASDYRSSAVALPEFRSRTYYKY